MNEKTVKRQFRLILEDLPPGSLPEGSPPVERRLAGALKRLLRAHGLRCLLAAELKQPDQASQDQPGNGPGIT